MDFKTTDALFNKIKEDFYSFDAAGLLDEGKFHKDVEYVLASLGIAWYKDEDEMLLIKDYKACLPDGFHLVESIYRCTPCVTSTHERDGIVFRQLTFDHYPETQISDPHIPQGCNVIDYWSQDPSLIFNRHEELLIQRGDVIQRYHPPTLMEAGNVNTKRSCSSTCPNTYTQSPNKFTIQNRKIHTNFEQGEIMLRYKSFPLDENTGLPLIPVNPLIEKAIEDYIKYNLIKVLRTNGDADVTQLIPLYQADMNLSMGKAITETKTPSFATMVHNVKLVKKRLNIYQFPNGH